MKSIVVLIAIFIVGYWLYTYYQENPGELPSITHRQKDLVTTPLPVTPEPVKVAPPNLASVPVLNGTTLTHARVKEARVNSVVFMCDQGLFEISYDRLSPDFKAFYAPTPTPVPTDADGNPIPTPTPTPAPTVVQPKPQIQRTSQQEADARLNYANQKAGLESRQNADLDTINRWYKQSTFEPGGVSQSQFESAHADYDAATAALNQLLANGP